MKVTIDSTSYTLSLEAAKAEVAVGDVVEARVEGHTVKNIVKETTSVPKNQQE